MKKGYVEGMSMDAAITELERLQEKDRNDEFMTPAELHRMDLLRDKIAEGYEEEAKRYAE